MIWSQRQSGVSLPRGENDFREPFERDRTRVIHSPSFRALQKKTQILGTSEGDFHRTRLTHSLEVSSIGLSILRNIKIKFQASGILEMLPSEDLITTICLLHDIGHPPFGHGGETALNYMMRDKNGFESNGQTLRLLTKLENSYSKYGLDLTRRTLLGVLKYPVEIEQLISQEKQNKFSKKLCFNDWLPAKGFFSSEKTQVLWLLEPFSENDRKLFQSLVRNPSKDHHGASAYKNFDCSIMDAADDIAYGVHDLEDAIHLKLIYREKLDNDQFRKLLNDANLNANKILKDLFAADTSSLKQAIGELINFFIASIDIYSQNDKFENWHLRYNVRLAQHARNLLDYLIDCIYKNVIDSHDARVCEHGGQEVILNLFEAISSNPKSLLNLKSRNIYESQKDEVLAHRIICDYIANMTDEHAYRMYQKLFGFRKL